MASTRPPQWSTTSLPILGLVAAWQAATSTNQRVESSMLSLARGLSGIAAGGVVSVLAGQFVGWSIPILPAGVLCLGSFRFLAPDRTRLTWIGVTLFEGFL